MVYAILILGTIKAYVLEEFSSRWALLSNLIMEKVIFITPYSEFQQLCKFMSACKLLLYFILIQARKFTAISDAKSDVLADHTTIA